MESHAIPRRTQEAASPLGSCEIIPVYITTLCKFLLKREERRERKTHIKE
jgi:hypothetical protein